MSALRVTGIQTPLHWQDKSANLRMFEDLINGLRDQSEIIILPEMFSTGFLLQPETLAETMDGETVQWMKRLAMTKKAIITGSVIIKEQLLKIESESVNNDEPEWQYFNRLIWMLPNGDYGCYDKRHRFAFAGEDENYTAGSKRLIASVNGWRINLLICYDLRFPVWSRQQPAPATTEQPGDDNEYDLLIYVANWPEKRSHAWKTLLQARAIENQCYVAGINRTGDDGNDIHYSGDSMVIDPLGEVLSHQQNDTAVFTVALDKQHLQTVRERFPFWKDRDEFNIL